MRLMRFFERLKASDQDFFQPLAAMADLSAENAATLRSVLADPSHAPELLPAMHDRRKKLDAIAEEVDRRLATVFMAPIDPEDVAQLNTDLHLMGDAIDDAARLFVAVQLDAARAPAADLCAFVVEGATQVRDAASQLKNADVVHAATARMRRIEREADIVYHEAMSQLFDGATDPVHVLKWKEVYGKLEDLVDMLHHTSDLLDHIAMKHL